MSLIFTWGQHSNMKAIAEHYVVAFTSDATSEFATVVLRNVLDRQRHNAIDTVLCVPIGGIRLNFVPEGLIIHFFLHLGYKIWQSRLCIKTCQNRRHLIKTIVYKVGCHRYERYS